MVGWVREMDRMAEEADALEATKRKVAELERGRRIERKQLKMAVQLLASARLTATPELGVRIDDFINFVRDDEEAESWYKQQLQLLGERAPA